MTKATRERIESALDGSGQFSVTIGKHKLTIKKLDVGFQITIANGGKPKAYVYRKRAIAVDRFEEQCDHFTRCIE